MLNIEIKEQASVINFAMSNETDEVIWSTFNRLDNLFGFLYVYAPKAMEIALSD